MDKLSPYIFYIEAPQQHAILWQDKASSLSTTVKNTEKSRGLNLHFLRRKLVRLTKIFIMFVA
jgi:hypothetical protein